MYVKEVTVENQVGLHLTILGGLIPARSAAKCNPVTALRSE